jgi:hypothetical protein
MASSTSSVAYMIQQGRTDDVRDMISTYRNLVSGNVTVNGRKSKVLGTVLHIAKAKRFSMQTKVGEKRVKRDVNYFRLIFLRLVSQDV